MPDDERPNSEQNRKSPPAPHDPFALKHFSNPANARSLFESALVPKFVEKARWPSLTLEPGQFIDQDLRTLRSDLLFSVQVGEETVLLYILFEHKSWVDAQARFQLLKSMVRIWDDWLRHRVKGEQRQVKLPLIIPFVLYHGQTGWTVSRHFSDLLSIPGELGPVLQCYIPNFEHALVDLHEIPMEELRGSAEVRLVLGLLKAVSEGCEEEWMEKVFLPAMEVLRQPDRANFVHSLFVYLARASATINPSTLRTMIDRIPDEKSRTQVMTLAEKLIEEGRIEGMEQGLERGIERGMKEARRAAILDVLEARFGALPPEVSTRLARFTTEVELSSALRIASQAESVADFMRQI